VFRIIAIFLLTLIAWATSADAPDTAYQVSVSPLPSTIRPFDDQALDDFRDDSDFQYQEKPGSEEASLWDRILAWILYYLLRTVAFLTTTVGGQMLLYTLCALIILYAIIKLFNIDVKEMFYNVGKSKQAAMVIEEEDIHEISFEQRIEEAYRKKDFRECVRLTFLFALKRLSDRQLILWKAGKTNDDYLRELKDHPARLSLQELRLYFDYAWYGHFEVDETTYKVIRQTFGEFSNKIQ
jgi:hypothetical protein